MQSLVPEVEDIGEKSHGQFPELMGYRLLR